MIHRPRTKQEMDRFFKKLEEKIEPAERMSGSPEYVAVLTLFTDEDIPNCWYCQNYKGWPNKELIETAYGSSWKAEPDDRFSALLPAICSVQNLRVLPDLLLTKHPDSVIIGVLMDIPVVSPHGSHRVGEEKAGKVLEYLERNAITL
jgi:hypothetical protein